MAVVIIIIVALVLIGGLIWILVRNSMIGSRNRVDEAWSGIDVQLKRRHDLVPNLVETVKGYATHEQAVFTKTTEARAEAMKAGTVAATQQAEAKLSGALADLRAVAENYPDLRATENFQQLQRNLNEIEGENWLAHECDSTREGEASAEPLARPLVAAMQGRTRL